MSDRGGWIMSVIARERRWERAGGGGGRGVSMRDGWVVYCI